MNRTELLKIVGERRTKLTTEARSRAQIGGIRMTVEEEAETTRDVDIELIAFMLSELEKEHMYL